MAENRSVHTSFVLPLGSLHFGHEAVPPINARRTDRDSEIEALAASLQAHGQIAPLSVTAIDGTWHVADGNRRLAALRLLARRGAFEPEGDVLCTEVDGDAGEISLAANVMRMPLHEADSLETFRDLADRGMSEADIAGRFGILAARVRRILAIGSLSPVILAAWRAGAFGDQAIQCVRAFTLARDHAHQEEVFTRLDKAGHLYAHGIRNALGAGGQRAGQLLAFIGREAYRAAGGAVTEDLFGENHILSDMALAENLAGRKIDEACEALVADGWKWAAPAAELGPGWNYGWRRLTAGTTRANPQENKRLKPLRAVLEDGAASEADKMAAEQIISVIEDTIAARGWSAEQKAEAGCAVSIGPKGGLSITRGLVDPAHERKAGKAGKAPEETDGTPAAAAEKEPAVSTALFHRLSIQATLAMRDTLPGEPRLGLITLLAGFLTVDFYTQPIRVKHEGYGRTRIRDGETFAQAFARLRTMTDDELHQVAAGIAATALDLTGTNTKAPILRGGNGTLAAALDPARWHTALTARFDAQDYFGAAPKALTLAAIGEALNADEARKAAKLGKADLVAFALANLPATGWLPPELRGPTYPGPGPIPAAPEREARADDADDDFIDDEPDGEDPEGRDGLGDEFDDEEEAA